MAQYVMTSGTVWMPELSVDNWDSITLVRESTFYIIIIIIIVILFCRLNFFLQSPS